MDKKSFSWGIIILMFILFFPVGIWMLVKKVSGEKYNYLKNGKSLKKFGYVLVAFGIIYLYMGLTGQLNEESGSSVALGLILFCGGGLFMLYKGKQLVERGTKYNRYLAIINVGNNTLIKSIAASYPTSYDTAAKDVQEMLDAGYFLNAYIDLNRRELIMPVSNSTPVSDVKNNNTDSAKLRTVKCPYCGATNTIMSDALDKCEYCGSPL